MSTADIIDDGEHQCYRLRLRLRWATNGEWGSWRRPSGNDYDELGDAWKAALSVWRTGTPDGRDIDVEVIKVVTTVRPVARISPATVERLGSES